MLNTSISEGDIIQLFRRGVDFLRQLRGAATGYGEFRDKMARAMDLLYDGEEFFELASKKVNKDVHGTGCHLSTAIAANMAAGMTLYEAVRAAKAYMDELFSRWVFKPGAGQSYFIDHR